VGEGGIMPIPGIPVLEGKYFATMDFYPMEAPEFNRISKFYENLAQKKLTTTKCKKCGAAPFPPRVVCPECNSDEFEWVELADQGKVLNFTEEVAGVPLGFDAPLIHAIVDLGHGLKLLSRIVNCPAGQLKEGDEVKLSVYSVPPMIMDTREGTKECARVFFAFEPVKK
jgi:uncharacterized OB-fold protein